MTCIECNYQWCWLCNNKYTFDHYLSGKCKGFQFFKPNNEKEIQLAFEGKIQLREDEQMNGINSYIYLYDAVNPNRIKKNFKYLEKFGISFIFCFFGIIIFIICESGKFLSEVKMKNRKANSIFIALYFSYVISFWLSIFFVQLFTNLAIFIFLIIKESCFEIFNNIFLYIEKIREWNVFQDYGGVIKNNIFNFIVFIISLFFGCPIWILKCISDSNVTSYSINNHINNICNFNYVIIIFLLVFMMYPLSLILNVIGIIEELYRNNFYYLKKYIQDAIIAYHME